MRKTGTTDTSDSKQQEVNKFGRQKRKWQLRVKLKLFMTNKKKTFFNSSEEVFKNTKDILEKVEIKKSSIYVGLVPTLDSAFWMDGLCLET